MTNVSEYISEAEKAKEYAEGYLHEARGLRVQTAEDYDEAAALRRQIKSAIDQAEAERKGQKEPFLRQSQAIDRAFKPAIEAFESAISLLDRTMREYRAAEEAKRKAAELKARELAEKERQRLEKLAAKAAAKGLEDTAGELARAADSVPTPVIETHVPKVDGLSARLTWKFEITDPDAIPREYLAVDEQAIGRVVRALKQNCRIPGIRVYSEESFASKR